MEVVAMPCPGCSRAGEAVAGDPAGGAFRGARGLAEAASLPRRGSAAAGRHRVSSLLPGSPHRLLTPGDT